MSLRRFGQILLILGGLIFCGSIVAYFIVNQVVPDPVGSDPQKDQYLFGMLACGLFGAIIAVLGGVVLMSSRVPTLQKPQNRP